MNRRRWNIFTSALLIGIVLLEAARTSQAMAGSEAGSPDQGQPAHADAPARPGKRPVLGSLEWLRLTDGHLRCGDRFSLLMGSIPTLAEGMRLGRRARKDERSKTPLARLEPPDTPMVRAARKYLEAHSGQDMINHSYRTAFWTVIVLEEQGALNDTVLETAWVAGLLHDVGLEAPPAKGDFSLGGVQVLESIAHELGWSEEQTHQAGEAIATNLCTHVKAGQVGIIGWAMNVGGLGELGFKPNRRQMNPERIAELETRYPRGGLRESSKRLIKEESRRVPDGRFAFLGRFFPLIMLP